jgi:hypothetical protein
MLLAPRRGVDPILIAKSKCRTITLVIEMRFRCGESIVVNC